MPLYPLLSAGWLEIIFEKRNKNYGAFELRSSYTDTIIQALCVVNAAFVFIMLISLNVNIYYNHKGFQAKANETEMKFLEMNLTPIKYSEKKKTSWKSDANAVVLENDDSEPEQKENLFAPSIKSNNFKDFNIVKDSTETEVDQNAEYPGGWEAMMYHFMKNINYNDEMKSNGVDAMVVVKIKIDTDGYAFKGPKYIRIVSGGNTFINNEVIRLVRDMKQWKPAKKDNQVVAQWMTIPIHIVLPPV